MQFAQCQRGAHRVLTDGFDQHREKRSAKTGQDSDED
jgi:hypothetical protein